jgi:hypothetical protein
MSGSGPASLSPPDHPVWHSLSCYTVGPEGAALSFMTRLAQENGWSRAKAERVFDEYRRFCFLAVTAGHEVSPSDAVDQAWHLHLTYSRDYWERFCPQVLGRPLHHGPTTGGASEHHRFYAQYARTLQAYEVAFGLPPVDIWPDAWRLLEDQGARRVHPRDVLILSRTAVQRTLAIAGMLVGLALLWSLI